MIIKRIPDRAASEEQIDLLCRLGYDFVYDADSMTVQKAQSEIAKLIRESGLKFYRGGYE